MGKLSSKTFYGSKVNRFYSDLSFWQHPKKKDFGKERKNAWVGCNLALAKGLVTKYYASYYYIRKRCVVGSVE